VITNSNELVYWQGLDSLCAPFLYLNFNDEALAYGCMSAFIQKYATRFFLRDNSDVIHEYLAVFSHLHAFHDPQLAAHFDEESFRPDLYAIPWFLTMFAHVFPLQKIFHLWDSLLLYSSAFPLCIGIAILKQLRNILLSFDFNECILLFSELPEINIAKCVTDSIEIYRKTPPSCTYRYHFSKQNADDQTENESALGNKKVDLSDLQAELCPRISGQDIFQLFLDTTNNDNDSQQENDKKNFVLIDIRPAINFTKGSLLESHSIPFTAIDFNRIVYNNQLNSNQQSDKNDTDVTNCLNNLLDQHQNSIKVIMTSEQRLSEAVELSNKLVRLTYSRVCILNRGVECLESTQIFQKPFLAGNKKMIINSVSLYSVLIINLN
jgi:TBC domain-containing protein kinase-like protein